MSRQRVCLLQGCAGCIFISRLHSHQRVFIDAENSLAIDLNVPGDIDKARLEDSDIPTMCSIHRPRFWKQVWPFPAKGATFMTSSNLLRRVVQRLSGARQTETRQAASWRRAMPISLPISIVLACHHAT
jgi:hypothetical protein